MTTISRHPDDETLARFAAGHLSAGPAVVIATHVSLCPVCAEAVAELEAVGGALLAAQEPAALASDALERVFARIDRPAPPARPARVARAGATLPEGIPMPAAIAACDVGPWRWVAPGARIAHVRPLADPSANLVLLRVAAGRRLPRHTHTGPELTQVLYGSFSDERGRYFPGDLDAAEAEVHHQPVVDPEGECICLAAIEGRMRPDGLISRALQPFFGL
jgi:putative transcriptional regulator